MVQWKHTLEVDNVTLLTLNKQTDKCVFIDHNDERLYISSITNPSVFSMHIAGSPTSDFVQTNSGIVYYASNGKNKETTIIDSETEKVMWVGYDANNIAGVLKNRNTVNEYFIFMTDGKVLRFEINGEFEELELEFPSKHVIGTDYGFYIMSNNEVLELNKELEEVGRVSLANISSAIAYNDHLIVLVQGTRNFELKSIKGGNIKPIAELNSTEYSDYSVYDDLVSYTDLTDRSTRTCVVLYKLLDKNNKDKSKLSHTQLMLIDINDRKKINLVIDCSLQKTKYLKIQSVIKVKSNIAFVSGYHVSEIDNQHTHESTNNTDDNASNYLDVVLSNPQFQSFINFESTLDYGLLKQFLNLLLEQVEVDYYFNANKDINDPKKLLDTLWKPIINGLVNRGHWTGVKQIIDFRINNEYVLKELELFFDQVINPVFVKVIDELCLSDNKQTTETYNKINTLTFIIQSIYYRKLREANINKKEQNYSVFLNADETALRKYKRSLDFAEQSVNILKLKQYIESSGFSYKNLKSPVSELVVQNLSANTRKLILDELTYEKHAQLNKAALLSELSKQSDFNNMLNLILYVVVMEVGFFTGKQPFDEYYTTVTTLPFYTNLEKLVNISSARLLNVISWTIFDNLENAKTKPESTDAAIKKAVYLVDAGFTPESIRFIIIKILAQLEKKSEILMLLNDKNFIKDKAYMEHILIILINLDMTKNAYDALTEYNSTHALNINFAEFIDNAKKSPNFHQLFALTLTHPEKMFLNQMINRPENSTLNFALLMKQHEYDKAFHFYETNKHLIDSSTKKFFVHLLKIRSGKTSQENSKGTVSYNKSDIINSKYRGMFPDSNISIHDKEEKKPSTNFEFRRSEGYEFRRTDENNSL